MAVTRLHILTRVMPNWNRPRQRMLTSGKRKKRPMLPFWSSRWSTDDTRLPYKIGGGAPCLYPGPVVEDPMSRGVIPFSVNNERCAIRKGSSSSLGKNYQPVFETTRRGIHTVQLSCHVSRAPSIGLPSAESKGDGRGSHIRIQQFFGGVERR
jgi:hypothetical protein